MALLAYLLKALRKALAKGWSSPAFGQSISQFAHPVLICLSLHDPRAASGPGDECGRGRDLSLAGPDVFQLGHVGFVRLALRGPRAVARSYALPARARPSVEA